MNEPTNTFKPIYTLDRVEIYCGNSLEILKQFKAEGRHFDLLLTDTPYCVDQKNRKGGGLNAKRAKASYDGDVFEDNLEYGKTVIRPIIDLALELCTLGIVMAGLDGWRFLPEPKAQGCMYCPASPAFNSWGYQDYYPIWYYGQPKGNTGEYRIMSHTVTEKGFSKGHPCSKPLKFWEKLMLCGTDGIQEKTILDPFCGSGTTGHAAQNLCMKATLIDLNRKYCDLSADNCSQMMLF